MVNLHEIEKEILDLEKRDTTYAVCERLAWLYIVRDHMMRDLEKIEHTYAYAGDKPERVRRHGESEFMEACEGLPVEDVLAVIDEHMEAIRALYPKEYEAMLRRFEKMRG